MNDVELDSALSELPAAPLPPRLRGRTLHAFDRQRPRRFHFSWKWGLAIAALCAATVGAFQLPVVPASPEVFPLPDGNRLVVRTVFQPTSLSAWVTFFSFRLESAALDGYYQQILHLRFADANQKDLGYRVKAQATGDGSYDLAFSRPVDPPAAVALVPAHVLMKLGDNYSLRLFRTAWFTCFTVSRTGANLPECARPPDYVMVGSGLAK